MTPHATHPSWPFDDACPDCAGYPAEPEPHGRRWLAVGLVLELTSAFLVIAFFAVIVRLAVSR